jgi:DNA-binding SARP family transcriptional activator
VEYGILGPLEVWHDGRPVRVTGAKQRALLAILLLHAGEVISSDRLMDDLWGEQAPAAGTTALRVRVSQLRKALRGGDDLLITHPPGYVLRVEPGKLDLWRFESLVAEGDRALARGDPAAAVERLNEALALWRGAPLADFAYAPFAQVSTARLEELRLSAIELRIDAELSLGRHAGLIGELQAAVSEHPLRERLWGYLMLALYRDGRQAEALAAYRTARDRLVEEIGVEPGPELRALERRILAQELSLDDAQAAAEPSGPVRTVLVLPGDEDALGSLLDLARPLAGHAGHELMIVALLRDGERLAATNERLHAIRASTSEAGVTTRAAAFTTHDPGGDALRLVTEQDVALLVLDAPASLLASGIPDDDLATVMSPGVCDVALVAGRAVSHPSEGGAGRHVLVPFSGHEHDWAALELGAWVAGARGVPLCLVGVKGEPHGSRDASRLLANASLALQRSIDVATESMLVEPGADSVVAAANDAALVVVGLSDRWEREGLGTARLDLAKRARPAVVFVRRGLRPSGAAPRAALTRFTWSAVRA